jgi:hypothetical protein
MELDNLIDQYAYKYVREQLPLSVVPPREDAHAVEQQEGLFGGGAGGRSMDETPPAESPDVPSGVDAPNDLSLLFDPNSVTDTREWESRDVATRPGQAQFRSKLLQAYSSRCAVTGCDFEAILDAAHIQPFRGDESNHISNGLLLRKDIHALFDRDLIAFGENNEVQMSPALDRSNFGSQLRGLVLRLPTETESRPNREALALRLKMLQK